MHKILALSLGLLAPLLMAGQSVPSNGFTHHVFWKSADNSFYHVSEGAGATDTHLIQKIQGHFYATDSTGLSVATPSVWTTDTFRQWVDNAGWSWAEWRDTLVRWDYLEDQATTIRDTFIKIHVGYHVMRVINPPNDSLHLPFNPITSTADPTDYLEINRRRVKILLAAPERNGVDSRPFFLVEKNGCPTGTGLSLNATFRTLPCLKTRSTPPGVNDFHILADPVFHSKLYLFYLSDSGRVVGFVSNDNGLMWEEFLQAKTNPVCTDSSDRSRSNLQAPTITGTALHLQWSGSKAPFSVDLTVPSARDTIYFYIKPDNDVSRDLQFRTLSDPATFRTQHTSSTPFHSIDRCIKQIIMMENGRTWADLGVAQTDTAPGYRRATATRSYVIRMLPGAYRGAWSDNSMSGGPGYLNRVSFPDWDRSLTIESYSANVDSYVVITGAPAAVNIREAYNAKYLQGIGSVTKYNDNFGHLRMNRLKLTGVDSTMEYNGTYGIFHYATYGSRLTHLSNLSFTNLLIYSVDSSKVTGYEYTRKVGHMLTTGEYTTATQSDNFFFGNCIFHRPSGFCAYDFTTQPYQYGGGFEFINCTFFHWQSQASSSYGSPQTWYWSGHGNRTRFRTVNCIIDSAPLPSPQARNSISSSLRWDTAGVLDNYTNRNFSGAYPYFDTRVGSLLLHKVPLASSASTRAYNLNIIDSILPTDFWGISREGRDVIGACLPGPDNPIRLRAQETTSSGNRAVRIYLDSLIRLSGVDTIMVFRDTLGYNRDIRMSPDAAYSWPGAPASYLSLNVPQTRYWFTVVAGKKDPRTGRINWSQIDPNTADSSLNKAFILLPDAVPPLYAFQADTAGLRIGADSLRFRVLSGLGYNPASSRIRDMERIYVFVGSDSALIVNNYNNPAPVAGRRDTSYPYIRYINPIIFDTSWNDTSDVITVTGLLPNTRYFVAGVPRDSSGNYCPRDSVIAHLRAFTTRQSPPNVLRVRADTLCPTCPNRVSQIVVTISGLSSLPASPPLDSARLKLFVRYGGYELNPFAPINDVQYRDEFIDLRGAVVGGVLRDTVINLKPDSLVYLSVTIPSTDGYYSRIVLDTNTFLIRTPRTEDKIAPAVSGVRLTVSQVTTPGFDNGLWLRYKLTGLNTVAGRDRETMRFKVMWSTDFTAITDPQQNLAPQEWLLTPDSLKVAGVFLDSIVRDVTAGVFPNRQYFFTASARDTASNWSIVSRTAMANLVDSETTQTNLLRPANMAWNPPSYTFTNLRTAVPAFRTGGTSDENCVKKVGVWILDTSRVPGTAARVQNADTLQALIDKGGSNLWDIRHKFALIDSANFSQNLDTAVFQHNSSYYVAYAPRNIFGNWGRVQAGQSLFLLTTPLDSTRIIRPANKCSLRVERMRDPDSVRVTWSLPAHYYTDLSTGARIDYDSVLIYYRTDGAFPSLAGARPNGFKLGGFAVSSSLTDVAGMAMSGVNCINTFRFSAFVTIKLPPDTVKYPQRISSDTAKAQSGPIAPPCAPQNQLTVIPRVVSPNQMSVTCRWGGDAASQPKIVRLMYRVSDSALTPPKSYGDGYFSAFNAYGIVWDGNKEWDTVIAAVPRERYLVAAYNAGTDTVFSKDLMPAAPGSQWDTVRMPPPDDLLAPPNRLTLRARALNSRSIELTWRDPTGTLPGLYNGENRKIALYYLFKNSPSSAVPYNKVRAVDAAALGTVLASPDSSLRRIVLTGDSDLVNIQVLSNRTYYFVVAPGDSNGNVIDTATAAKTQVALEVPRPSRDSLAIGILSDTAFFVNFERLINQPGTDTALLDPFVQAGLVIVSDSGIVDSNLFLDSIQTVYDIINERRNTSSRTLARSTFVVQDINLRGGSSVRKIGTFADNPMDLINLNRRHYVSFAFLTDSREPSKPVHVGSLMYKLDPPFVRQLDMRQINDSVVRVTLQASDSSDTLLGLSVQYAVNDTALLDTHSFEASQILAGTYAFVQGLDSGIVRDQIYTSDILLRRYFTAGMENQTWFANSDSSTLSLRFALTDLHGPQPKAPDLTLSRTVRVDTRAPSTANQTLSVRFGYDAPLQQCTVVVVSTPQKLAKIRWSTLDSLSLTDSMAVTQNTTQLVLSLSTGQLYLRFLDSLANRFDTSFIVFGATSTRYPAVPKDRPYEYDSRNLKVQITSLSLDSLVLARMGAPTRDSLAYFIRKYSVTLPSAGGFGWISPDQYAFLFTHPTLPADQVWEQGLRIGIAVDSALLRQTGNNLFIYAYHPATGAVTFVGGTPDGSGYITANGLTFPVVSSPAMAGRADSVYLFLASDTTRATVTRTEVVFDQGSGRLSVRVGATDNTQSLICRVKIIGYDTLNTIRELFSGTLRTDSTIVLDTPVTFAYGSSMIKRGVFAAVWVTDQMEGDAWRDRRIYSYARCNITLDSVQFTLRNLNKYQIISLPYELSDPQDRDVLHALMGLSAGKYDRERFRLYRVLDDRDTVAEFSPSALPGKDGVEIDPNFKFNPGSAFFMITRDLVENDIPVVVRQATLPQINFSSRGYRLLGPAARTGWYVVAPPFAGPIDRFAMQQASSLRTDGYPFQARLRINPANWSMAGDTLYADDVGKGFAVYLYQNEQLVAPVVNDPDFLNPAPALSKSVYYPEGWRVRVSVGEPGGDILDAGTELGIDPAVALSMSDFQPLNLRGINLGIRQGNGLLMCDVQKADGAGKTWTLELANRGRAGDLKLTFEGLSKELPQGWQVWCEDKSRNCAADLLENNGRLPVFAQANSTLKLTVVAGDALFVERNISRKAPAAFELAQNAPNPFNPATCIRFALPDYAGGNAIAGSRMVLDLFDARGRFVKRLLDRTAVPGYHSAVWDAKDRQGRGVASGLYFYRLAVSDASGRTLFIKNRKMLLAR